jgi:hypothetical protein
MSRQDMLESASQKMTDNGLRPENKPTNNAQPHANPAACDDILRRSFSGHRMGIANPAAAAQKTIGTNGAWKW